MTHPDDLPPDFDTPTPVLIEFFGQPNEPNGYMAITWPEQGMGIKLPIPLVGAIANEFVRWLENNGYAFDPTARD